MITEQAVPWLFLGGLVFLLALMATAITISTRTTRRVRAQLLIDIGYAPRVADTTTERKAA